MKGESKAMDLPFLLPRIRIFRAFDLTPNLKMRYGTDIHIVPEKLRYLGFSQYIDNRLIWSKSIMEVNLIL